MADLGFTFVFWVVKIYDGRMRYAAKKAGQACLKVVPFFAELFLSQSIAFQCLFTIANIPLCAITLAVFSASIPVLVRHGAIPSV